MTNWLNSSFYINLFLNFIIDKNYRNFNRQHGELEKPFPKSSTLPMISLGWTKMGTLSPPNMEKQQQQTIAN